jgi:hypothetical protein
MVNILSPKTSFMHWETQGDLNIIIGQIKNALAETSIQGLIYHWSIVSKHLFTLQSFPINKRIHVFFSIVRYIQMIKCEHCDVKAHYRLSIQDFNSAQVYSANLCINCITIEESKIAGDFLVTKSLKIEPLISVLNRLAQK